MAKKKIKARNAREIAQGFSALAALSVDLSLDPSTHVVPNPL